MAPPARLHMEVLLLPRQDMPASLTPIRCISAFFLPDLGKDTDNKTAVSDAPASSHRRLLPHSTLPVPDVSPSVPQSLPPAFLAPGTYPRSGHEMDYSLLFLPPPEVSSPDNVSPPQAVQSSSEPDEPPYFPYDIRPDSLPHEPLPPGLSVYRSRSASLSPGSVPHRAREALLPCSPTPLPWQSHF